MTTVDSPAATTARRSPATVLRSVTFRALALTWAAALIVMFGQWRALLSPWLVVPDEGDHGWVRTPELHRLADSAAAATMVAVAVAAVVLAARPAGRSGLAAWTAASLTLFGLLSPVSSLMQGHDVVPGLITAVVWVGLTAVTFLVAYPEGRAVARGGVPDATGPTASLRTVFTVGTVIGVALAIGGLVWRLTGGVVEDPLEDDVVSFLNLGATFALGCWLCRSGRAGWRPLAAILAGVTAYAVVGGASLALG